MQRVTGVVSRPTNITLNNLTSSNEQFRAANELRERILASVGVKQPINTTTEQAMFPVQHAEDPTEPSLWDRIKSVVSWEVDLAKNILPIAGNPIPGASFALSTGRSNLANLGGFFGIGDSIEKAADTAKYVFYTILLVGGVILFSYVRNSLR